MIQDTSIAAWRELQEKLGYNQKEVLAVIRQYPNISNLEIADKLDWPINCVTPRVQELRKKNLVEDGGKRKDKISGRTVHVWHIKPPITLPPAFPEKQKVEENPNQLL